MSMTPITELPENPSIEDFRRYEGTLYVRNNSVHAVTCNTPEERFLLQPYGFPDDCKIMPRYCLDHAGFQKMVRKGHLTVSPDLEQYAIHGERALDNEQERHQAEIEALTEENSSSKDLVQGSCLVCRETVFQTYADVQQLNPPLCSIHADRASHYLGTPVQNDDGTTRVNFALLPNRS